MALTKATGNMYEWVSHMHSHLRGACPHQCSYCYAKSTTAGRMGLYDGPLKLAEKTLTTRYDSESIRQYATDRGLDHPAIFVDHMNDLWAEAVPAEWIEQVLAQCCKYPDVEYVFQTKNPARYFDYIPAMPPKRLLGCTIETTEAFVASSVSAAPDPSIRSDVMHELVLEGERTFITIEPILRSNMQRLSDWCCDAASEFVNIGADSKGNNLDEPSARDVALLIDKLREYGVEIREKHNLDRLLNA